ncbi:helix-turn-helix transcriptional regulator [Egibacter rhizosphaerae]|uniref:helix-turn-helix transcriptional regulator n=1 Tax=Egibacter rhizosphaerae TaxID=1670831 RepID=UPI0013F151D3|nr:helix-turn-helix domain-containing protein [Egibacter rhizosphaerae]
MTDTTDGALVDLLGETRARVVGLVHRGPRTVAELAAELDLSDVAVRRHVHELEQDGLVEGRLEPASGRGRPGTRYQLTGRGERLFPDRSAALAGDLLEFLGSDEGLEGFLAWRRERQRARYAEAVQSRDVETRTRALAEQLTADGYEARVERTADERGRTVLRLTQEHCAIRQLAASYPQLCGAEEQMFADLLGAPLARTQTQAGGAGRCVCEIPLDEPAADDPTRNDPDDPHERHDPEEPNDRVTAGVETDRRDVGSRARF